MRRKNGALLVACVAVSACASSPQKTNGTAQPYPPGTPIDLNCDGTPDGVAADGNGDGISDGVDTNRDGIPDVQFPATACSGTNAGGDGGAGFINWDAGSSNGGGGGGGYGDSDSGLCEQHAVASDRLPPDMLIVLDRSGSMEATRWAPSVSAIESVTAKLENSINFGLMAFPGSTTQSTTTDCTKDFQSLINCFAGFATMASCQTGSLVVPIATMNASKISMALGQMMPSGGTPTSASLKAAHDLLGSVKPGPDQIVAPKYVLLVTDGEPNCTNGTDPVAATVNEIKSLAADGIKTYVVGFNTNQGTAKTAMDMMAAAGGTGATTHIEVEDGTQLQTALQDITGKAISCTFVLDQKPADPSFVSVQVNGKDIYLNQANGWTLGPDGKTVEVKGASCDTLRVNATATLAVNVQCQRVIPL